MLVNLACDWQRPSGNWPCAWRPSDYYRFLLSDSRNRFLSTDLQSAFWKLFGKEPSLGFPMDLTNLHALPNDQKAASRSGSTSHQLAFRPLHTRHQHLTDGLGLFLKESRERASNESCPGYGSTQFVVPPAATIHATPRVAGNCGLHNTSFPPTPPLPVTTLGALGWAEKRAKERSLTRIPAP